MNLNDWASWILSVIFSAVYFLAQLNIFGVSLLHILLAIIIMGVVIRAIPFRA